MYKRILIMLLVIVAMTAVSCKNKTKSKLPDRNDKVTEYATIPSFKVLFLALDKLELSDITSDPGSEVTPLAQDKFHQAFYWGVLATDAQLAIRKHDSARLNSVTAQLTKLAPLLAMQDIGTRIKDGVQPIIKTENWDVMEIMYFNMQYSVEQHLLETKQYELYSLVTLGGWTETTNQLARLIYGNFTTEKASVILQPEAWNSISQNLGLFSSKQYIQTPSYKKTRKQAQELTSLMTIPSTGTFSQDQLKQVIASTEGLKAAFLK